MLQCHLRLLLVIGLRAPGVPCCPWRPRPLQEARMPHSCRSPANLPTMLQGAGAYGFDPIFSSTHPEGMGCLTVPSPATGQMTCAFWSDQPFNISFCSNTSYIPWCGLGWAVLLVAEHADGRHGGWLSAASVLAGR